MTSVVVDTDVVSYVFKNHPFGSRYHADLVGRIALISFMTVAEIERWVLQYRWGNQRIQVLRTFLQRFTVVPSSPDLCRQWAEVTVTAQAGGRRIESADAWICRHCRAARRTAAHQQPRRLSGRGWNDAHLARSLDSRSVSSEATPETGRRVSPKGPLKPPTALPSPNPAI
jgi:tRNA(fMet)-specific endonuclease VapC